MKNINIKGFEHYLIDENGNVYNSENCKRIKLIIPKMLKTWPNKNTGYMQVCLQNSQLCIKTKCLYVHRLVATAYLPNPLNLPEVNHKDFDKTNNSVDNLEWVTTKQNKWHSMQYGKKYKSKSARIIEDKKLLNKGLKEWDKSENIQILSNIWNCSTVTAYKILEKNNKERNRYGLPNYIRLNIIEEIKNHKSNIFGNIFLKNLIGKYKVNITHHQFYKMKKEAIGKKFIKKSL